MSPCPPPKQGPCFGGKETSKSHEIQMPYFQCYGGAGSYLPRMFNHGVNIINKHVVESSVISRREQEQFVCSSQGMFNKSKKDSPWHKRWETFLALVYKSLTQWLYSTENGGSRAWILWNLSFCFISWKKKFSNISRKYILPNMIGAITSKVFMPFFFKVRTG